MTQWIRSRLGNRFVSWPRSQSGSQTNLPVQSGPPCGCDQISKFCQVVDHQSGSSMQIWTALSPEAFFYPSLKNAGSMQTSSQCYQSGHGILAKQKSQSCPPCNSYRLLPDWIKEIAALCSAQSRMCKQESYDFQACFCISLIKLCSLCVWPGRLTAVWRARSQDCDLYCLQGCTAGSQSNYSCFLLLLVERSL